MATIRMLPQEIRDKIAAGEVVERPASVIKELVENSLDAGATRVQVTVGPSLTDRLEVEDNGSGMTPDGVRLAVLRHATSKISCEEDLYRISTLGFRGEALASIGAVAELQIDTRPDGEKTGVRVTVNRGTVSEPREVGMPRGTRVCVRDLFGSTPARLKFLRSPQTETGHVLDTFLRLALSRIDVTFQLKRGGGQGLHAPTTSDLKQRAAHLFGWELAERLRPVSGSGGGARLHGLVGPPEVHRGSQRGLFLFVNRRPVRDLLILRAIHEAYRGRVPSGRIPVAILFLELPYSEVDVNAHPAKTEVHFSRPQEIRDLFLRHVARGMETDGWAGPRSHAVETGEARPTASPLAGPIVSSSISGAGSGLEREDPPGERDLVPPPFRAPECGESVAEETPQRPSTLFVRFRILGQFQNTYLVCEYGDRLILIDQHAAHERIAYDRLAAAYARNRIVKQPLLVPAVVELPPREAECLRNHLETLAGFGMEVEPYGGMSFAVKTVPAILSDADPARLLQDLADELVEQDRSRHLQEMRADIFARMACHSVVRAGRVLQSEETEALLKALDETAGVLTCPHGRPVMIAWSLNEVEKRFQRV